MDEMRSGSVDQSPLPVTFSTVDTIFAPLFRIMVERVGNALGLPH